MRAACACASSVCVVRAACASSVHLHNYVLLTKLRAITCAYFFTWTIWNCEESRASKDSGKGWLRTKFARRNKVSRKYYCSTISGAA